MPRVFWSMAAILLGLSCVTINRSTLSADDRLVVEMPSIETGGFDFSDESRFDGFEPFGAEDKSAEQHAVRVPEPLVFDLVRPLGVRKGEFEVNTLALFP